MAEHPDRSGSTSALSVEGLTYRYANADGPALRQVSLRIEPGEFVLLAGRSGCGKTTLLRAGCGLVPHFHGGVLEGKVEVAGRDTCDHGPGELADVVGYVAQEPESQVVSTTVAAELDLPLRFKGDEPSSRARAIEEVALGMGIPHLLRRTVDTLSGGELQRVALAVALVTRPPLILLDEPTSQLDPVAGDELIWLLRRLNEQWGVAVVAAEHRLERSLPAADRVIAMEDGRIAFDGTPRRFLDDALERDPVLATPASRLFSMAGIEPIPVGVRDARAILRADRPLEASPCEEPSGEGAAGREGVGSLRRVATAEGPREPGRAASRARGRRWRRRADPDLALEARGLWVELDPGDGPRDVLRDLELSLGPGERVALMGRNGAGKSTLLRAAAGLLDPVKGGIETPRGMALLTQSPADFLVRERVAEELPGEPGRSALEAVGLDVDGEADPRDLSGGQRQRLALAIALAGRIDSGSTPGVVALDEPTRGMDRACKDELTALAERLSGQGAAVLIATHDVEFAAGFATRVVLLGEGEVIADADTASVLSGGWYFATEVARILDRPGVIDVESGAGLLVDLGSGASR